MPRRKNGEVERAFELFYTDDDDKCQKARCNYCGHIAAQNTTRQHKHLDNCSKYILETGGPTSTAGLTAEASKRRRIEFSSLYPSESVGQASQVHKKRRVEFPALDPARKERLDRLAARAVFCGARPLNLFEQDEMKAFLQELNPGYSPPDRYQLANKLSDNEYGSTKATTLADINSSS